MVKIFHFIRKRGVDSERICSQIQSLKWLTYYSAWLCDHQTKKKSRTVPLFTSIVKHHVPETEKIIIDETITIFGGYG